MSLRVSALLAVHFVTLVQYSCAAVVNTPSRLAKHALSLVPVAFGHVLCHLIELASAVVKDGSAVELPSLVTACLAAFSQSCLQYVSRALLHGPVCPILF